MRYFLKTKKIIRQNLQTKKMSQGNFFLVFQKFYGNLIAKVLFKWRLLSSLIIVTDLVLDAMKNVKLEPNAIPEWAKNLSEENWQKVLGKLQNIKPWK